MFQFVKCEAIFNRKKKRKKLKAFAILIKLDFSQHLLQSNIFGRFISLENKTFDLSRAQQFMGLSTSPATLTAAS